MDAIIETQRLILREFHIQDAESLYTLNADPIVLQYTGDSPFLSVHKAEAFIREYDHYKNYGYGRWACILKHESTMIGWCGLKHNEEDQIDLGFRLHTKNWNQGFATEAGLACLRYGFRTLGLDVIVGRSDARNKASIKVLEKIGMSYWKRGGTDHIPDALYYRIYSNPVGK